MTTFAAAPLDTTAKVVSGVVVVILLGSGVLMVAVLPIALGLLLGLAYLGLVGLIWALAPASYAVEAGDLVVQRNRWRPYRAPLQGLAEMEDPGRLGLRMGGSGGGFGYYGRFRRRDIGAYRAYLTTREAQSIVAVQTRDGVVAVSPADPAALVQAIGSIS